MPLSQAPIHANLTPIAAGEKRIQRCHQRCCESVRHPRNRSASFGVVDGRFRITFTGMTGLNQVVECKKDLNPSF